MIETYIKINNDPDYGRAFSSMNDRDSCTPASHGSRDITEEIYPTSLAKFSI